MKHLLLTAMSLLFLFSCTEPTQGMFYSIENEKKTGDETEIVPNTITVGGMTTFNFNSQLYLAANSLYIKDANNTWSKAAPSLPNLSSPLIYDVESNGGTSLFLVAGDGKGSSNLYKSTDGNFYTQITTTLVGLPMALVPVVKSLSSEVLLITSTNQVYSLTGGNLNTTALLPAASYSTPVTQAVYHGSNYYLVNKSYLFTGANLTSVMTSNVVKTTTGSSLGDLGGITSTNYLSGTTAELIISTSFGTILNQDGADWKIYPDTSILKDTTGSTVLELGSIFEYTRNSQNVLLMGNIGHGYSEAYLNGIPATVKTSSPAITGDSLFSNSSMGSKASVTGFHVFKDTLYASSLAGFWKNSGNDWNWE